MKILGPLDDSIWNERSRTHERRTRSGDIPRYTPGYTPSSTPGSSQISGSSSRLKELQDIF